MNILGMGPLELVVILGLALIVFGPEKLPEIGGQIGRAIRDFRRTTSELSEEFKTSLKVELEERNTIAQKTAEPPLPYTPPALPPAPASGAEQPPGSLTAEAATEPTISPPASPREASSDASAPTTEPPARAQTAGSDLEPPY